MWSGYTPSSRQSTISSPIAGPSISPTSTYPPEVYRPRSNTPHDITHRKSLSRVEEMDDSPSTSNSASTTGAQLVARDYALQTSGGRDRGGSMDDGGMETETEDSSCRSLIPRRRLDSPIAEDVGERLIPPESIHDKYLSKYIQPLGPTEPRPAAVRSTSTPAIQPTPSSQAMSSKASAIPLRGLGFTETKQKAKENVNVKGNGNGDRPIFEIFNAELNEDSERKARALKGHLDNVLRVQKEIGRMHLALEGLGDGGERRGSGVSGNSRGTGEGKSTKGEDEDPLAKREREVDELMKQLSALSANLRTYHELGTPTLEFSHSNNNRPISPTTPNPPVPLQRQKSAQPDILTTSPTPISPSPPRADVPRSLPTRHPVAIHKGIDNLKRQEGGPSRRATHHQDNSRQASVNSDLSPLKLSVDDYDDGKKRLGSPAPSFWDLDALTRERDREKAVDNWMEHGIAPDESRRASVAGSLRNGIATGKGRKGVDSPIEMIDRSRPW